MCDRGSSRLLALLVGFVLLSGCTLPFHADSWERVVGVIEYVGSPAPIELPETVQQGVPFTATVVTFGSGTCIRSDGAEVQVVGLTATITPHDLVPAGETICTDDLVSYPREVTLSFDVAGEATIRVIGRTLHPDGPALHEMRVRVEP